MNTIELNVYSFDELSEKHKQTIIELTRLDMYGDEIYYDMTKDDIKYLFDEKLQALGFYDIEYHFDLSYCQGSGSCFDAEIDVNKVLENMKRLDEPNSRNYQRLINTGNEFLWYIDAAIVENASANHYCHFNTRDFIVNYSRYKSDKDGSNIETLIDIIQEQYEQLRTDLCKEIHKQAQKINDSFFTDELIIENLLLNESEFVILNNNVQFYHRND